MYATGRNVPTHSRFTGCKGVCRKLPTRRGSIVWSFPQRTPQNKISNFSIEKNAFVEGIFS